MRDHTHVGFTLLLMAMWGCGGSGDGRAPDLTTTPTPPSPPAATISSISPVSAKAGSADVMLTVKGSGFDDARLHTSLMAWSPIPGGAHCCNTWLDTKLISDTELAVVIPADLLRAPVTAWVFVENGDPQGITDGVLLSRIEFDLLCRDAVGPDGRARAPSSASRPFPLEHRELPAVRRLAVPQPAPTSDVGRWTHS